MLYLIIFIIKINAIKIKLHRIIIINVKINNEKKNNY